MFRRPSRAVVVLLLAVALAAPAGASNDVIYNVAQPLLGHDMGLLIGYSVYAGYQTMYPAGLVTLTCSANATRILGRSGPDSPEVENRNAANIVGLSVRHILKAEHIPSVQKWEPFFGDTLKVAIEIPAAAVEFETQERFGWRAKVLATLREVVCATISCMRINAGNQRAKLRYLTVQVEGWDAVADLSGTYSLEQGVGEAPRQFGYSQDGRSLEGECE